MNNLSLLCLISITTYLYLSNEYGQLGQTESIPQLYVPHLIPSLHNQPVSQIAAGANHSILLMGNLRILSINQSMYLDLLSYLPSLLVIPNMIENGDVLSFGLGSDYRLGHNDTLDRVILSFDYSEDPPCFILFLVLFVQQLSIYLSISFHPILTVDI